MFNFLKSRSAGGVGKISGQDAVNQSQAGALTIIDVREHAEVSKSGKAKGALHIPLATLQFKTDPKNPDFHPALKTAKPVALYCASGARSHMAAGIMLKMGFSDVSNLGHLGNWTSGGGQVVR
ncbi:MAG: rhodanese-like domain-containing protein [Paracoccaceae bacterium]